MLNVYLEKIGVNVDLKDRICSAIRNIYSLY